MLHRLDLRGLGTDLAGRLPRPDAAGEEPVAAVQAILADVRARGDEALAEFTERFDGVRPETLRIRPEDCRAALERVPVELRAALEIAHGNIERYHQAQAGETGTSVQVGRALIRELTRPVDRAGLYVPGGRASYPSTVLMTAIPAKVAGVPEVVLCVPPRRDGSVPDEVLAAAALAGVDEVYRVGGAQAIAAMAYGTESIRPVDVIVGPGNIYVAVAKREVAGAGIVGVPSAFAGPSEIVVVADDTTPAELAALDLVVQAEHGPDGLAWLVTWSESTADAVSEAVEKVVANSPRRDDIESTLAEGGYCVVCDDAAQAMAVANLIAPEHLELMTADPESLLPQVRHAGAVFCGPWAPASVGDYAAGPNHVLPTHGSARFSEALRVDDFRKHVHVVTLDRDGLAELGPSVIALAEAEGLPAHAESVRRRLQP
jgi:histidinol dehydrogenase